MELPADYLQMNATDYKIYHESYMQNNQGSSAFHTLLCIGLTMFCTIICSIIKPAKFVLLQEYLIIVCPMVFCHTLLAKYIYYANLLILTALCAAIYKNRNKINLSVNLKKRNTYLTNRIASISIMRGLTYLITIFAILAVDFRTFPKYLAKTERYGYSLMDTGVGLFILMSGLVHKDYSDKKFKSFINDNLKLISVLSILGVSRFVSVKQLNYQEHVTEYGVHWNFFFTLAAAKALSSILIFTLYPKLNYLFLSFIVITTHELLLLKGLQDFVFSDVPRNSFVTANREGLISCLGYVAMYLFAAHFKKEIVKHTIIREKLLLKLLISTGILWILAILMNYYRPTSRTLANASYCLYLESVLLTFMTTLYFFEIAFLSKVEMFVEPCIVSFFNENGLLLFLSSNLLTGAVNLNIRTLFVEHHVAVILLNCYMVSVICIAVFLKSKGFRI